MYKKVQEKLLKQLVFFWFFSVLTCNLSCSIEKSTEQVLEDIYAIASQMDNLQSLIIIHNDEIIKEEYNGVGGPGQSYITWDRKWIYHSWTESEKWSYFSCRSG